MIEDSDDLPWLRLYRRGSARFQQLEPHHRGTLIEVLRYTDPQGRINLDGRSPEEALLRLLGNTRSFRPVLKSALAEGFRIKMLSVIDGHLVFESWSKYQPQSKRRATEQSNDRAAAEQEQSNDRATTEQLQSNDRAFAPNPAESLNTQKEIRVEKSRVEEIEEGEAPGEPAQPSPEASGEFTLEAPTEPASLPGSRGDVAANGELSALGTQTHASVSPKPPEGARELFEHWRSVMGKSSATKLDDKRKRRCEWAIREYGIEAARLAIDGCARSDWHMGRDPRSNGVTYNDLSLIFRDSTHFERFRDLAARPSAGRVEPLPNAAYVGSSDPELDAVSDEELAAYERQAAKGFFYG